MWSLKSLNLDTFQGVACEHTGDHNFCSYLHKRCSEAIRLSVLRWCQWGGKRSLEMALKPTTNKRCPLSAGHTPLEADSHQVSVWSFRRRRFRMVHIESLSRISIYLVLCETTELCLVCPVFSANSLGAFLLTEVRIIKWVVERPVFGLLNVQSQFWEKSVCLIVYFSYLTSC